ncbi:chitinase [Exophiala viscosa]|uniref:chitinase n=1 Tax=Exophiala viscosa TaxID=2486360 RepID=UPI00219539BC|nr:chitinase [Exophiala viscosa]
MLISNSLVSFTFPFLLCISPIAALGPGRNEIASDAQDLLDNLKLSHRDLVANLRRRDPNAEYWTKLAGSQPSGTPSTLSDELSHVLGDLGSSLNQLIQILSSLYDIAPPILVSDSSSSTVLPITALNTASSTATTPATTLVTAQATIPTTTTEATPTTISVTSPTTAPTTTSAPAFTTNTNITSTIPSSSSSTTYTFNPQASNLNVVYYSQTDLTSKVPLTQICNDPSIDIIILAFVTELFANGGWPALNLGSNCWAASAAQQAAGATGLLDCVGDGFNSQITTCQSQGKKVLLSLGGSTGNLAIPSDEMALEAANTLWSLFLGGSNASTSPIRPFGSVVLDGIDLDNESPSNEPHLAILMSTLRSLLATDTSKQYYLTAAPQCPQPDQSIPVPELLPYIDFFGVQFYNNPSCQVNAGQGFLSSVQSWSQALQNTSTSKLKRSSSRFWPRQSASSMAGTFVNINNGVTAPRLLIGTPAFAGAGSGFVSVSEYQSILQQVAALDLPNLAGAMFWDGAYEVESGGGDNGTTYAQIVREVFA